MPSYIYRVTRRTPRQPETAGVPVPETAEAPPAPTYRELQAEAKDLGISGKQKSGKLKKAIAEAKRNGK